MSNTTTRPINYGSVSLSVAWALLLLIVVTVKLGQSARIGSNDLSERIEHDNKLTDIASEEVPRGESNTIESTGSEPPGEPCSICLENISSNDEAGFKTCRHKYHANCLKTYLTSNLAQKICPYCRQSFRLDDIEGAGLNAEWKQSIGGSQSSDQLTPGRPRGIITITDRDPRSHGRYNSMSTAVQMVNGHRTTIVRVNGVEYRYES